MTAAWVVMIVRPRSQTCSYSNPNAVVRSQYHLEIARYDLSLVTDQTIPEWVTAVIYGTVILFWSFSAVQILGQRLNPGFYFGALLRIASSKRKDSAYPLCRYRAHLLRPLVDSKNVSRLVFVGERNHE